MTLGRHFAHAEFQQQDVFARLFQQPAAKKGVVAIYLRLPRTPLQKGIVPHPGRQHPPTVRAARNSLVRQMHTLQPIRQFLHHLPILPNIVPAGLAALAVAKVTLKGADLFRGKHRKNCRSTLVVSTKVGLSATSARKSR